MVTMKRIILWDYGDTYVTWPVQFALVVDDFRVKYVSKKNAQHLIDEICSKGYKLEVDWQEHNIVG